jgi:hypothetical protein
MTVSLAAYRLVVHADRSWCRSMYETRNETAGTLTLAGRGTPVLGRLRFRAKGQALVGEIRVSGVARLTRSRLLDEALVA